MISIPKSLPPTLVPMAASPLSARLSSSHVFTNSETTNIRFFFTIFLEVFILTKKNTLQSLKNDSSNNRRFVVAKFVKTCDELVTSWRTSSTSPCRRPMTPKTLILLTLRTWELVPGKEGLARQMSLPP